MSAVSSHEQVRNMKRSLWSFRPFALAAALIVGSAASAIAQSYPQQPIKIIIPFAAGGGGDVVGRAVGEQLAEAVGQPIVIENVAGAGGTLGTARAAKSPPDGYTLFVGTPSTHGTNVAVYPKLPYDAIKDFEPVGLITTSPLMLIVSPTLQANSVADFIRLAKEKPGELAYGSFGTGSINHLASELLQSMADIKTNHIPYRGSAPALTDLIAGRIQYTIDGPAALPFINAGTVKLLAVGSSQRWNVYPNTPTIAEAGVPGYEALTWFGLFAPAGTPKPVVSYLNAKLNDVLKSGRSKETFARLGVDAAGGGPEMLAKTVDTEVKKWVKVATEKNIKIEP
jgi:tripartite-type tricarboxylate transporter receptor subunit TctC